LKAERRGGFLRARAGPAHCLARPAGERSRKTYRSSVSILDGAATTSTKKEAVLRQTQATLDQAVAQSKITSEQDKSD